MHADVKRLGRIIARGHRIAGDCSGSSAFSATTAAAHAPPGEHGALGENAVRKTRS
jgi:hypothetical protein